MSNFETEEERRRFLFIQNRLKELSNDFIQAQIGAQIENLETKKEEFKTLHNELREILGKQPREYK